MENQNVNPNEMSSEDLGLLIFDLLNQRNQIDANLGIVRNILIERKPKTQIIAPQENTDGTVSTT
jgi:hypothetical protein